jgi:drug/metabolite transporter (DMT)-like permease
MLILCVIWGVQQVVMKSVAADIPPLMQLGVRFAGSALVFGGIVLLREGWRGFCDGTLLSGLVLGLLFTGEFIAVALSLTRTSASHTTVFLYSAPIFTALGVQIFPEERLTKGEWVGVGFAFIGIAVAFMGNATQPTSTRLIGDLIGVLAGAFWGVSTVWLRRTRVGSAATYKTVFYQVSVAAAVITTYARLVGQSSVHWSPGAIIAMTYQTLGIAVLSYLTWFWLLRHYQTSRLMLLSPLTPIFGVISGWAILGEAIDTQFAVGTCLVLGGILAINARQIFQRS